MSHSASSAFSLPRPAFNLAQHGTLSAWSARRLVGLAALIATVHEYAEEVIEIVRHDPTLPLWFVSPIGEGAAVVLSRNDGRGRELELASLQVALSTVEAVEAGGTVWVR